MARGLPQTNLILDKLHGPVPVKFVDAPAGMLLLKFVMLRAGGLNVKLPFTALIV